MKDYSTKKIKELAIEYPQTIKKFDDFAIDYYCDGEITIDEICKLKEIDFTEFTNLLNFAILNNTNEKLNNVNNLGCEPTD